MTLHFWRVIFDNGVITSEIVISKIIGDKKYISSVIERNCKSGFWTQKNGIEGIIEHEVAHSLEAQKNFFKKGVNPFDMDTSNVNKRFYAYLDGINHKIANDVVTKVFNNYNIDITSENLKKYISGYASKIYDKKGHLGDALAEALSDSSYNEICKAIREEFLKW